MNNFTPRAQQVLALSRKEADRFNHNYVGTEHLLLGLLRLGQGVAVNALLKLGLDLETVRIEVEKQVGAGPDAKVSGNIPYTPRVKKVLALAGKEAKQLNHSYVGTEHILLGLLREGDGASARVLRSLEVDLERVRIEILEQLAPESLASRYPERPPARKVAFTPEETDKMDMWLRESPPAGGATTARSKSSVQVPPDIAGRLASGETLLWTGAPKKKFRFERKHVPLLLFMIPFCAFMFLPIIAIVAPNSPQTPSATPSVSAQAKTSSPPTASPAASSPQKPPPLPVRIFMALFALCFIGGILAWILYCTGFSLGGNAFLQGETLYAITDQRLIIVAGKKKKTVRSVHLGSATDLRMKEWPDGLGSITFGPEPMWPYPTPLRGTNTLIENIANPREVFQIIITARKTA